MRDRDIQTAYWDSVACSKEFTHPIPVAAFQAHIPATAAILDYGCGYGRVCGTLADMGYCHVTGIDTSAAMIARGKTQHHDLDLRVFDGASTGFDDGCFDACLAMALLTCIPSDAGQEQALSEMHRVLKPGGVLFVSDYPLQCDARNLARYREYEKEFGAFGVFRTEGAVFRHHDMKRIHGLLHHADIVWEQTIPVRTMNGHASDVFQIMARKRA
ncbi:MAG: methyltransferase domain-containing protein [Desulfovibrionaceae bacterium]